MGLKVVFRLEEYKIPDCPAKPFDWERADVDCIIDLYRNASGAPGRMDYFAYFQDHPTGLLFYLINLPLDDPSIPTPTMLQQRQYVAYFYQKVKEHDPNHDVYANTHYGADDKLPQAPVADLVDGVTLTVYATRESWAPYDCGTIPTFTDPDYKIVCKDQYDYFIDKALTENRVAALGKPLVIDQTGFAYEYEHPGQTNGRVADKLTKFKAIHILARLLKEKAQLAGWGYFMWLDKVTEANWGLLDEGHVYDLTPGITHTVVLTDLNPGTTYSLTVGSDGSVSSGHRFTTTVLPSTENHPRITITAPPYGNAVAEGKYVIAWVDGNPDSNATISLFYDANDRGTDGITITTGLSEDDPINVFTWTVPSTLTGAVFVYARIIDDGENLPEYDYSSGMLVTSLEHLPVARAHEPITIDGALSEAGWSDAKPLTYATHPPANGNTSATVRALWDDDEFLYVGFDVADTQVETAAFDWDDDSVSIIINNGTFRCRQDVGGTGEGICERALQLRPGTTLNNPGDTDAGFTMEMKVPWTQVRVIPNARDIVPADLLSVDHDGNPGGAWDDPATIFSKISWDGDGSVETTGRSLLLLSCSQGPINPPSSETYNLDRYAADWGVYCEGAPTWIKENVGMPSLDGESLRCSITGGAPYSNVHCYRNLLPEPITAVFTLTMSFWFSPTTTCNNQGNPSVVQAIEFTMNKWQQAKRYEWALQWQNVGTGAPQWRYWDGRDWVPVSPTVTQCLQGNQWHTFALEGEIVGGQVHYQRFIIDGNQHILDLTILPVSTPGESDRLAIAIQLDGNATESPYDVFVDQVNFVRKPATQVYLPLVVK